MLMITHPTANLIKQASGTFSMKEQEENFENDLKTESSRRYIIS
jgi:hypothetical protein